MATTYSNKSYTTQCPSE